MFHGCGLLSEFTDPVFVLDHIFVFYSICLIVSSIQSAEQCPEQGHRPERALGFAQGKFHIAIHVFLFELIKNALHCCIPNN